MILDHSECMMRAYMFEKKCYNHGGQFWYTWISIFPTYRLPTKGAFLRWGILRFTYPWFVLYWNFIETFRFIARVYIVYRHRLMNWQPSPQAFPQNFEYLHDYVWDLWLSLRYYKLKFEYLRFCGFHWLASRSCKSYLRSWRLCLRSSTSFALLQIKSDFKYPPRFIWDFANNVVHLKFCK